MFNSSVRYPRPFPWHILSTAVGYVGLFGSFLTLGIVILGL